LLPPLSLLITVVGLAVAFVIFAAMAASELRRTHRRAPYSLKLQLAVATFIWLIGESLTVIHAAVFGDYEEFLEIHTISMGIFALIVVTRLPQLLKRSRND